MIQQTIIHSKHSLIQATVQSSNERAMREFIESSQGGGDQSNVSRDSGYAEVLCHTNIFTYINMYNLIS